MLCGVVAIVDAGVTATDASEVDAQPPDIEKLVKTMEQTSLTSMSATNSIVTHSDTFIFYVTVPGTIYSCIVPGAIINRVTYVFA